MRPELAPPPSRDPDLRQPPVTPGPASAIARGMASTRAELRRSWREVAPAARRAWLQALGIGFALCAALAFGLAWWGERRAAAGMQARDEALLRRLVADDWLSFQSALWLEALGGSAILIPAVVVGFVAFARSRRPLIALTLLAAFVLHEPLVWLGWQSWDRARPTLVAGGIAAPPLHSYPSGHAVQTLAVWGLFAWAWFRRSRSGGERAAILLLLLALHAAVVYARLRIGTHWPSDMAAGTVLGGTWLAVCVWAQARAEKIAGRPL
jgi:membrane-associated phospholipid phosphatase